MLDFFRRGSKTLVVRLFFALLALSFAIWGVGDVFRGRTNNNVAEIGREEISFSEFQQRFRQETARFQSMMGAPLKPEQALAMQLHRMVLENLVNQRLFEMEAARLGVQVGNEVVADAIRGDRTFYNEKGEFDRDRLIQVLRANGLGENQYFAMLRQGIATEFLTTALLSQHVTPSILADTLVKYRNEKRKIDVLEIPLSQVPLNTLPEPTNEELVSFHEKHQDLFSVPEYRSFSYFTLGTADVTGDIAITEDVLKSEYESRKGDYQKPERRVVDQLLYDNEEAAKEAYARLEKGEDFMAVARTTRQVMKEVPLGEVTKEEMVVEVREPLFALKKGEFSKPVKSPFGWSVFRVDSILSPSQESFEEARSGLEKALKEEKAGDELYNRVKEIEDAFAGGSTLEEVAKKFNLKIRSVEAVDRNLALASGTAVEGLPESSGLAEQLFSLQPQEVSSLTLTDDNASYFAVRVDAVKEARVRALDEMRGVAIEKWKEEAQQKALKKLAEKVAKEVEGGKTLVEAASELSLTLKTGEDVFRPQQEAMADIKEKEFPNSLLEAVFNTKPGNTTGAFRTAHGTYAIATVDEVEAYQAKDSNKQQGVMTEIGRGTENDIFEQYNRYMRGQFPVSVNEQLLKRVVEQ